ncbi:MAG: Lysine exporter protein [Firmicutes bacterium]|nr:Lysine exporter protein [Bacillota bacterium]
MLILIKGIVLGFSIAAPVGPIGLLCIRRTLANGMGNGFISGLGAATADAIYGFIAALGISAVSIFLVDHQSYLRFIGGVFLLYLGYTTFKSMPAEIAANTSDKGLIGAYASTLFLTITNPMTIMSFAAAFAGLGVGTLGENYISSFLLVIGVFIGSMLWWLILSGMVNVLRHNLDRKRLKLVNQLSGLIITAFGLFSLFSI